MRLLVTVHSKSITCPPHQLGAMVGTSHSSSDTLHQQGSIAACSIRQHCRLSDAVLTLEAFHGASDSASDVLMLAGHLLCEGRGCRPSRCLAKVPRSKAFHSQELRSGGGNCVDHGMSLVGTLLWPVSVAARALFVAPKLLGQVPLPAPHLVAKSGSC